MNSTDPTSFIKQPLQSRCQWHLIPYALLDLVFSNVDDRHRLISIESVCRQWRNASCRGAGWTQVGPDLTHHIDTKWIQHLGQRLHRTTSIQVEPNEQLQLATTRLLHLQPLTHLPRLTHLHLVLPANGSIVLWSLPPLPMCTQLAIVRKQSNIHTTADKHGDLWGIRGTYSMLQSLSVIGRLMPDFNNWSAPMLKELSIEATPKRYHSLFRGCPDVESLTLRLPALQWDSMPPLPLLRTLPSLRSLKILEPLPSRHTRADIVSHQLMQLPSDKLKQLIHLTIECPSYEGLKAIVWKSVV